MTPLARAAIFSPYAALTGFEGQIAAARHQRCNRIQLTEEELLHLNDLLRTKKKHDTITLTYFLDDPGSDGQGGMAEGEYIDITGKILDIIPAYHTLRVGTRDHWVDIDFADILSIS